MYVCTTTSCVEVDLLGDVLETVSHRTACQVTTAEEPGRDAVHTVALPSDNLAIPAHARLAMTFRLCARDGRKMQGDGVKEVEEKDPEVLHSGLISVARGSGREAGSRLQGPMRV